jgi:hypothetical protein
MLIAMIFAQVAGQNFQLMVDKLGAVVMSVFLETQIGILKNGKLWGVVK